MLFPVQPMNGLESLFRQSDFSLQPQTGRFGQAQLPVIRNDTVDDEWIENVEDLGAEMDKCIEKQRKNAFEIRYQTKESIDPK